MNFSQEKNNSREVLRIYESGYNTSCGYYSQNCWVDDDRLVISRHPNPKSGNDVKSVDILLVDLKYNSEKLLLHVDGVNGISTIVYGTTLYYVEDECLLCSLDVDTMERKEIYKSQSGAIELPHITADGRYLNWFDEGEDKKISEWVCYRLDLETGEVIEYIRKSFLPPFRVANHFMINPKNPDIMFFAHEGDTTYVTNRLWIAPLGKEPYNIAKQRLDENGNLIDCFGHESWAADGKGLYFVKYDVSPSKPTGIGYVDIESGKHELLFTGYKYWHVCAAPNGKYLAGDLGPNDLDENDLSNSGICLMDLEKGTEELLVNVTNQRSHPGHPHPQFNPSCTRICFHDAVDKATLSVGIINI